MSMADRARQLVGLLAVSEDSVAWLAGMLRDVFEAPAGAAGTRGASVGDERRRRRAAALAATATTACAPLVAAIREYMLELHGDLDVGLPPEPGAPTAGALMVACTVALRTFARAAGHLVAPHLEMLALYVRGLEGMGAEVRAPRARGGEGVFVYDASQFSQASRQLRLVVTQTLTACLPHAAGIPRMVAGQLVANLRARLEAGSPGEMIASAACLGRLATQRVRLDAAGHTASAVVVGVLHSCAAARR